MLGVSLRSLSTGVSTLLAVRLSSGGSGKAIAHDVKAVLTEFSIPLCSIVSVVADGEKANFVAVRELGLPNVAEENLIVCSDHALHRLGARIGEIDVIR